MAQNKIQILSASEIDDILIRMAYQVLEFFYGETQVHIIGIADGGLTLARLLERRLGSISSLETRLHTMRMDKENPQDSVTLNGELPRGSNILLVDDVANSGRTLTYALPTLLETDPRYIKIAVLVDRKHKRFPVKAGIVGRKLSTNLSDHVIVEFDKDKTPKGAYLIDL